MCGIVGTIGKNAIENVIDKLKILEYRGYDSCGVSFIENNQIKTIKSIKSIDNLKVLCKNISSSNICIGHTRWATHGEITLENAHPHISQNGIWSVVHNGIIENYIELKNKYLKDVKFYSQTDTEIIPNLLEKYCTNIINFITTCNMLKGSFAICCINKTNANTIYIAKNKSPLYIGYNNKHITIASDLYTFNKGDLYYEMKDMEFAKITNREIVFYDKNKKIINKKTYIVNFETTNNLNNEYEHYMLKEIHEIPSKINNVLKYYKNFNFDFDFKKEDINNIYIIGCGSAYHTGLIGGNYLLNDLKIPTFCFIASEFRYSSPVIDKNTLCIFVSQSGETADTLACMEICKNKKAHLLSLTNVENCSLKFGCKNNLYMCSGKEVAVATTKAFTTGVIVFYILSKVLKNIKFSTIKQNILKLKKSIESIIINQDISNFASQFTNLKECFFIGRNLDYYVSMEGALKLKEIAYINCLAVASGELKHGTLALVDNDSVVFTSITQNYLIEKTMSNVKEVESRKGKVFIITTKNIKGDNVIKLPSTNCELDCLCVVTFYQLLSYYVSTQKGISCDKPKNLAKSVTVE